MHDVGESVAWVAVAVVKQHTKPVIHVRGGAVHGKCLLGDYGANVHFGQCPVARDTKRPVVIDESNENNGATIAGQLRTKKDERKTNEARVDGSFVKTKRETVLLI